MLNKKYLSFFKQEKWLTIFFEDIQENIYSILT